MVLLFRACEMVPGLSSRFGRALEKVIQKIGSASDVGLAGFGALALGSGTWTVALLVNDTLSGSSPSRAAKKFEELLHLDDLIPLQHETPFFADQCALTTSAGPRSCKSCTLLSFETFAHDETALNLRTVATDTTLVVRDQKCQLSDNPSSHLDSTASSRLNLCLSQDFLTGNITAQ